VIVREPINPSTLIGLAPGLDVADIAGDLVLRTDIAAVRLEGGVASLVRERFLPALTKPCPWHELLEQVRDLPREEVDRLVDRLVSTGLLVEAPNRDPDSSRVWRHLVAVSAEGRRAISERAACTRVVVVGLPTHQVHFIEILARAGVGNVLLADPFPPYPGEPRAMGAAQANSREDLVRDLVSPRWPMTQFASAGATLTKQSAADLVADSQLVVISVDRAMAAARHWINRATLDAGIPSIYADVLGYRAELGPVVLPGDGPCYLCWRMRAIACEDDFASAMAWEERFDRVRAPPGAERPVLPSLPPWIAGVLGHEALAVALGIAQPRLAGAVLTIDGLRLTERLHRIIRRPDCPACRKSCTPRPPAPRLAELVVEPAHHTDFDSLANAAVSARCGIVRALDRIPKDVDDPEQPVIVRAELANATLSSDPTFVSCAGKGATWSAARAGALGEALECYGALTWIPERRVYAARRDLDGRSIDPRDLVLFAAEQYSDLPYAPYDECTPLDWVPARSLAVGDDVWVPLLAAHLGYHPPDLAGSLFPATSSSGFAAESTIAGALLHALLEVVERDAFVISWAHRWAGRRSNAVDVPDDETQTVAKAYARRGVLIDVHVLPTDTVPVVLAAGWSEIMPAVVIGLGADLDPAIAARRAVLEVAQVRPSLRARLRMPETADRLAELVADAGRVRDVTDHDLLYSDPATAHAGLAYLLSAPVEKWDAPRIDPQPTGVALMRLVETLVAAAGDAFYIDVTPDDVVELGMHVVRGIVPSFQPIHFGAREARLGGTRLRQAPELFQLGRAVSDVHELNLFPHPLS
jgi:bacteriocin biosynthesis cyclodehydratase domain-containing protein